MTKPEFIKFRKVRSYRRKACSVLISALDIVLRHILLVLCLRCRQGLGYPVLQTHLLCVEESGPWCQYHASIVRQLHNYSMPCKLPIYHSVAPAFSTAITNLAIQGQLLSSHPVSNRWLSKTTWGADIDYPAFMVAMGAIDILLDLLVLALPVPIVVKLHVNRNKKIQILAIFALGGL